MASSTQWTWIWADSRERVKDREAWRTAVHRVAKSWTRLRDWTLQEMSISTVSCDGPGSRPSANSGRQIHWSLLQLPPASPFQLPREDQNVGEDCMREFATPAFLPVRCLIPFLLIRLLLLFPRATGPRKMGPAPCAAAIVIFLARCPHCHLPPDRPTQRLAPARAGPALGRTRRAAGHSRGLTGGGGWVPSSWAETPPSLCLLPAQLMPPASQPPIQGPRLQTPRLPPAGDQCWRDRLWPPCPDCHSTASAQNTSRSSKSNATFSF